KKALKTLGVIHRKIPNTYFWRESFKSEKSYKIVGFLYWKQRREAIFYHLVKKPFAAEVTL
ncbi:hypothetical protein, partial [Klebsiella oxytoca]|uniref:hypothetical protein n=1 Tax=Klebsiella oxytoca TaxID=571 RepID=UPI001CCA8FDB